MTRRCYHSFLFTDEETKAQKGLPTYVGYRSRLPPKLPFVPAPVASLRQAMHSTLLEDFPKEQKQKGSLYFLMLGGSRASPRLPWLPTVSTVPGTLMFPPLQSCRLESFYRFPEEGRSSLAGVLIQAEIGSQVWLIPAHLHPQIQRCSSKASWYPEISRDGFDGPGLKGTIGIR